MAARTRAATGGLAVTFERILAELQEGRRLLEERGVVVAADSGAFDLLGAACRELDERGQALDAWRSLGDAAADEIESRWHAHTDEEGAGPVSLVRRLRSRDGALYTPEGWRERQAVVAYLRAHGLGDTAEQIKRGDHRSER